MYFLCCLKSPGDYMRQAFIQGGLLFKEIWYACSLCLSMIVEVLLAMYACVFIFACI